ncbi:MAG: DUF3971 domain-containing protein [Bacteroidales bacterium]|nr:DUF3971 domain-containing protein [Bacteroidales bacterium]
MNLKRIGKKIIVWCIGIIAFFIVATSIISYIYQDKIIQFVTDELSNQIQGKITIEKINLSFFRSFPNTTIQLHNVVALSTDSYNKSDFQTQNTDTAVTATIIGLAFNIFDFLQEDFIVQEIKLFDAHISMFFDKKGKHNMMFIKESDEESENNTFVDISKIIIKQTRIELHDASSQLHEHIFFSHAHISGALKSDGFKLQASARVVHENLQIHSYSYLPKTSLEIELNLQKQDNTLHINTLSVSNPDFKAALDGTIALPTNMLTLQFSSKITNLHDFSNKIDSDIAAYLQTYAVQSTVQFSGNITGALNSKNSPQLSTQYSLENGSFIYNNEKITFASKGTISSNSIANIHQYSLQKASVNCAYKKNKFNGIVSVLNFGNPELEIDGKLQGNTEIIHDFIDTEGYTLSGKTDADIHWKGKLSAWNSINNSFFTSTQSDISCNLESVSIESPSNSPYTFSNISGNIQANNHTITINNVTGKLQNSPFELSGTISNFLASFFIPHQRVQYNLTAFIESLNANPFVAHYDSLPDTPSTTEHYGIIHFSTNYGVYDIYKAQNLTCDIHFSENEYFIKNWKLRTMGGSGEGNTLVEYKPNNTIVCTGTANLTQVSGKELFKTFHDFEQTFLTKEQISGNITSAIQYKIIFDTAWNILYPFMDVIANVHVADGSINDFEPFVEIGKKLKVEEFKTVKFKELKNTIKIANDTLFIPNMDISSNAFEMVVGGKHSLSNNFAYYMIINMKSTLSNRFKKNNKIEDFGEIEQNPDGTMLVPLKIIGNADAFSIDFDFKTQIQQVKQSVERQRDDWREILQKTDTPEDKKEKEKPIQTDFQIHYD